MNVVTSEKIDREGLLKFSFIDHSLMVVLPSYSGGFLTGCDEAALYRNGRLEALVTVNRHLPLRGPNTETALVLGTKFWSLGEVSPPQMNTYLKTLVEGGRTAENTSAKRQEIYAPFSSTSIFYMMDDLRADRAIDIVCESASELSNYLELPKFGPAGQSTPHELQELFESTRPYVDPDKFSEWRFYLAIAQQKGDSLLPRVLESMERLARGQSDVMPNGLSGGYAHVFTNILRHFSCAGAGVQVVSLPVIPGKNI